jgi:hypothetical protein
MYEDPTTGSGGALAARIGRALGPTLVLALRHAVRRRRRLALSLILLAVGGGTFMSGLNVAAASDRQLASGVATLGYDLELSLGQPQPTEPLLRLVQGVPGVAYAETVGLATVAPVRAGEAPVARTHKDGGHGTERLYALAPGSRFRPAVARARPRIPALGASVRKPVSRTQPGSRQRRTYYGRAADQLLACF